MISVSINFLETSSPYINYLANYLLPSSSFHLDNNTEYVLGLSYP